MLIKTQPSMLIKVQKMKNNYCYIFFIFPQKVKNHLQCLLLLDEIQHVLEVSQAVVVFASPGQLLALQGAMEHYKDIRVCIFTHNSLAGLQSVLYCDAAKIQS